MGKGRDKRKKREDSSKATKRAEKQSRKLHKNENKSDPAGSILLNNEEPIEATLNRIQKAERKIKKVEELEKVGPPTPRVNVVMCPHPTRESEIIIFGGEFFNGEITEAFNEVYFYHTKRCSWSKLSTAVNPAPRSSSQGIVYKQYMIIFGGEFVSQSQSQFLHFRDVWRFDAKQSEWTELKTLKGGPSSRSGHRMSLWKRQAVLFGGFYDNAQECHYFNDVWLLSSLEGSGRWEALEVLSCGGEVPRPRSGHNMAVTNDTLFVYGGYSTEKFNRFKKSEATMHHDLWMLPLPAEKNSSDSASMDNSASVKPSWIKIRLNGIPPPIRCGVGSCVKDKKMFLFGGVVDLQSPGGKLISTFSNDLFAFHMDTKNFYPVVLRSRKSKPLQHSSASEEENFSEHPRVKDLEAELKALNIDCNADSERSSSTSSDDDEDALDFSGDVDIIPDSQEMKQSYEVNKLGQIVPHRRMDAAIVCVGNNLYVYGGQFESGNKEITMSDLYCLNLNRLQTYEVLLSQDLSSAVWMGKESECSAHSWESGSTFVSTVFEYYDDDEEEDEVRNNERDAEADDVEGQQNEVENHEEDSVEEEQYIPTVIPVELPYESTPKLQELRKKDVDGITRTGKNGLKVHKDELLALLNSISSTVPTPERDETLLQFFERTSTFWEETVQKSSDKALKPRRLRKEAVEFCRRRFREAKELLEQIRLVEEQEREEIKFLRQRRLEKEKEWDEWEKEQQQMDEEEKENINS